MALVGKWGKTHQGSPGGTRGRAGQDDRRLHARALHLLGRGRGGCEAATQGLIVAFLAPSVKTLFYSIPDPGSSSYSSASLPSNYLGSNLRPELLSLPEQRGQRVRNQELHITVTPWAGRDG